MFLNISRVMALQEVMLTCAHIDGRRWCPDIAEQDRRSVDLRVSSSHRAKAILTAIVKIVAEMWWHMAGQPHLHASLPKLVELYL